MQFLFKLHEFQILLTMNNNLIPWLSHVSGIPRSPECKAYDIMWNVCGKFWATLVYFLINCKEDRNNYVTN